MINMGLGCGVTAVILFPAAVALREHWQAWWIYGCVCTLAIIGFVGSGLGWDR